MKFSDETVERVAARANMHAEYDARPILEALTAEDIALALVGSSDGSAITVGYQAIRDAAFEEAAVALDEEGFDGAAETVRALKSKAGS